METIYVVKPGAYLRREGMTLKVVKGSDVIDQIPAEGLKRLTLIGYVSLSSGVLDFLIKNRIETVFITPTGRFRARLVLNEHRHVALRKAQYLRLADNAFALETAKIIVRGKLDNTLHFLLLRARQYADKALSIAAAQAKGLLSSIGDVRDMEVLRGMEGAGARIYFQAFPRMLRNDAFVFNGRNRRPPLDPVNALLSFVYTLLTNEVLSAVNACGLDPYMGALHEISYGRPSIACDLVEEYRCFLGDRLVLGLINRKAVKPEDFIYRKSPPDEFVDEDEMKKKRPVEMKPAISRALISAYEEMMKKEVTYDPLGKKISYRWLILQQARQFGAYLQEKEAAYTPFTWRI
jgi:CRISP-associated protein Cas1